MELDACGAARPIVYGSLKLKCAFVGSQINLNGEFHFAVPPPLPLVVFAGSSVDFRIGEGQHYFTDIFGFPGIVVERAFFVSTVVKA